MLHLAKLNFTAAKESNKMKKISLFKIYLLFITSLLASGCNLDQSTDIAIIDLDAIAKATGQDVAISQQINTANQKLNAELDMISQKLNEQLAEKRKEIGETPSQKQAQELKQITLIANQRMQQAKNIALQKSQQIRAALILQLRKQIQPIAEEVGQRIGARAIFITDSSMLWYDPAADITGDVITEVRALSMTSNKAASETSNNNLEEE